MITPLSDEEMQIKEQEGEALKIIAGVCEPDTVQSTLDVITRLILCLPQMSTVITFPPFYKSRSRDTLSNLFLNHPRVTQGSELGPFRGAEGIFRPGDKSEPQDFTGGTARASSLSIITTLSQTRPQAPIFIHSEWTVRVVVHRE